MKRKFKLRALLYYGRKSIDVVIAIASRTKTSLLVYQTFKVFSDAFHDRFVIFFSTEMLNIIPFFYSLGNAWGSQGLQKRRSINSMEKWGDG